MWMIDNTLQDVVGCRLHNYISFHSSLTLTVQLARPLYQDARLEDDRKQRPAPPRPQNDYLMSASSVLWHHISTKQVNMIRFSEDTWIQLFSAVNQCAASQDLLLNVELMKQEKEMFNMPVCVCVYSVCVHVCGGGVHDPVNMTVLCVASFELNVIVGVFHAWFELCRSGGSTPSREAF